MLLQLPSSRKYTRAKTEAFTELSHHHDYMVRRPEGAKRTGVRFSVSPATEPPPRYCREQTPNIKPYPASGLGHPVERRRIPDTHAHLLMLSENSSKKRER